MKYAGLITVVVFLQCEGESQVSLNRTTPSGMQSVCPNTTAVFTCRVTDSHIIAWSSIEYLGQETLAFTTYDVEGSANTHNTIVAILQRKSGNSMVSELRINARLNSSIRCFPSDHDSGKSIDLAVYNATPGRPTDVVTEEIPSTKEQSCDIRMSWEPPTDIPRDDISHYIIRDSVDGVHNERSINSTMVTIPLDMRINNVRINVTTVDRCGREGPSSAIVEPRCQVSMPRSPETDNSTPRGSLTTSTTNNIPNDPTNLAAIAVVAIPIIVVVVVVILFKRSGIACFKQKKKAHLTINHLSEVDQALRSILRARWLLLGQNLKIKKEVLETIAKEHSNPELRFTAVLNTFLIQEDPKPTWKQLADALPADCDDIAKQLRKKYL